ncbi:RICIN domain-containing protein [Streptomyces sp. NPDC001935]
MSTMRHRLARVMMSAAVLIGLAVVPVVVSEPANAASPNCSSRFDSTWSRGPYFYAAVAASNARGQRTVMDLKGPSTANGTQAHIWHWYTGNSQYWCLKKHTFTDGSYAYQMRNYYGGGCLDVAVNSPIANGDNVWQWGCKSSNISSQLWAIEARGTVSTPDGSETSYVIRHDDTTQCVDVKGEGVTDGTTLQTWSCKYSGNQLFY